MMCREIIPNFVGTNFEIEEIKYVLLRKERVCKKYQKRNILSVGKNLV